MSNPIVTFELENGQVMTGELYPEKAPNTVNNFIALANSGYYVITAAHSTEESVNMGYDADEDGILDKHFGLFTYMLTQGSGWNMATNKVRSLSADSDGNGEITLHEAYSYARYKALNSNPDQTAQVYPSNSSMVIWAK